MGRNALQVFIFLIFSFCVSGCSSFLTYVGPAKSELKNGETIAGDFSKFDYDYHAMGNRIVVEKTPMCNEKIEKLRVTAKQRRGLYLAILEMPFFGLGLFDMLRSYAIVEQSRRVEKLGTYDTGETVACGTPQPADEEVLIIQNAEAGLDRRAPTNAEGVVDLDEVLAGVDGPVDLTIKLIGIEHSETFSFLYDNNIP